MKSYNFSSSFLNEILLNLGLGDIRSDEKCALIKEIAHLTESIILDVASKKLSHKDFSLWLSMEPSLDALKMKIPNLEKIVAIELKKDLTKIKNAST